jgi:hypothetical protein
VRSLRSFCYRHIRIAALVIVAALALKALIPAGYMIASADGFAIVPCPTEFGPAAASGPAPATPHDHHAMVGHSAAMHHVMADPAPAPAKSDHGGHAAAQQACSYAILSLALLPGADPIQLAAALAFVLALWLVFSSSLRQLSPARLRPPSRAPPRPL